MIASPSAFASPRRNGGEGAPRARSAPAPGSFGTSLNEAGVAEGLGKLAILQGEEPSGLTLDRLTKRLTALWEEQRARFGFAGRCLQ